MEISYNFVNNIYHVLVCTVAYTVPLLYKYGVDLVTQDLDLGGVATAYGLLRLPKMPELKRIKVTMNVVDPH